MTLAPGVLTSHRCLFLSFYCTIQRIFEPLRVFEPGFNTDKYGTILVIRFTCRVSAARRVGALPLLGLVSMHIRSSGVARPRPTRACALPSTFQALPSTAKQEVT